MKLTTTIALLFILCFAMIANATQVEPSTSNDKREFAYVNEGIFYLPNGEEVKHLGVNYSPSFAFGFRSIQQLKLSHKDAIDMDIDHIQRLGLNAYRIHVWEKEISDSDGNIIINEHLKLLDYTISELAKRNIKVILTPIAWWGNGYPEPDSPTNSFSANKTKNDMNEDSSAIKTSKEYLKQFVNHKNTYSGVAYKDDNNIIAFELFNEPRHAGKPSASQNYINNLVSTLKNENVQQPLFYNISEQGLWIDFANSVCQSDIDGIAFQWYPTGLVRNSTLNANTLINVASYMNPFSELAACNDKVKMVYEFDPSDTLQSSMYAAMARSFRTAGFQWATQFAYDPAAIAHSNAEYNTHYMSLLYTPKKAMGLKIAAEVFRSLPLYYKSETYPKNNKFEDILLKPLEDLSVFNNGSQFLHSNQTTEKPINPDSLRHVAGVKSSPLVTYDGSGAYFLDKIAPHVWVFEIYPDVISLQDPFKKASRNREVRRLYINERKIKINLPNLSNDFYVHRLDKSEDTKRADERAFSISPGKYLLVNNEEDLASFTSQVDANFLLPDIKPSEVSVSHLPQRQRNIDDQITLQAQIEGLNDTSRITLNMRYKGDSSFTQLVMKKSPEGHFFATVPKTPAWSRMGILEYSFTVSQNNKQTTFPGASNGSPSDWDFVASAPYFNLEIRPSDTPIAIFDHDRDNNHLVYPQKGRGKWETVAGENGLEYALRLSADSLIENDHNFLVRTTLAIDNSLANRDLSEYQYLIINVKAVTKATLVGLDIIDKDGFAFGVEFIVEPKWQNVVIPLTALKPIDSVLSQAYPNFMPSYAANTSDQDTFDIIGIRHIQGLQFRFPSFSFSQKQAQNWQSIEVANVYLAK